MKKLSGGVWVWIKGFMVNKVFERDFKRNLKKDIYSLIKGSLSFYSKKEFKLLERKVLKVKEICEFS